MSGGDKRGIVYFVRVPVAVELIDYPYGLEDRCNGRGDALEDTGGAQHLLPEGVRRHIVEG